MALTDRNKKRQSKPRPKVEQEVKTTRFPNTPQNNKEGTEVKEQKENRAPTKKYSESILTFELEKPFDSKQRKTIKVDPDVKSVIEIFGDFEGRKEYEMIREMARYYYENNFDERAQRIISSIQSTKFIN
ncbi:hypothetical protein HAX44_13360 [Enterococcus faecalis]|uniref:hypothetical protein n=1 Tax=Enterococcus faecalis TaxID=1351 RepID=UPI00188439E0|nr:hypothetical protein [Enterococcus faecalis]MBF0006596.1 hypothetical protein [Enterococcus faecalis]MBF0009279.1 hypothetical protein [Enterococcus faecalis]MBF0018460.1 hypothetical protein [Enterococcus faecalis]